MVTQVGGELQVEHGESLDGVACGEHLLARSRRRRGSSDRAACVAFIARSALQPSKPRNGENGHQKPTGPGGHPRSRHRRSRGAGPAVAVCGGTGSCAAQFSPHTIAQGVIQPQLCMAEGFAGRLGNECLGQVCSGARASILDLLWSRVQQRRNRCARAALHLDQIEQDARPRVQRAKRLQRRGPPRLAPSDFARLDRRSRNLITHACEALHIGQVHRHGQRDQRIPIVLQVRVLCFLPGRQPVCLHEQSLARREICNRDAAQSREDLSPRGVEARGHPRGMADHRCLRHAERHNVILPANPVHVQGRETDIVGSVQSMMSRSGVGKMGNASITALASAAFDQSSASI